MGTAGVTFSPCQCSRPPYPNSWSQGGDSSAWCQLDSPLAQGRKSWLGPSLGPGSTPGPAGRERGTCCSQGWLLTSAVITLSPSPPVLRVYLPISLKAEPNSFISESPIHRVKIQHTYSEQQPLQRVDSGCVKHPCRS